jgi:hypothetical protein
MASSSSSSDGIAEEQDATMECEKEQEHTPRDPSAANSGR